MDWNFSKRFSDLKIPYGGWSGTDLKINWKRRFLEVEKMWSKNGRFQYRDLKDRRTKFFKKCVQKNASFYAHTFMLAPCNAARKII